MFCVWVENPLGMFSVGSFPLIASYVQVDNDTMVLIIEQFLMLILIIGRWMLPKVSIRDRQTDTEKKRQRDRQTEKQTDRETDR